MLPVRTLRLLPAALAVYELRCLVHSLAHVVASLGAQTAGAGSASLWLLALLALGAGLLLSQMGRGLRQVGTAAGWRPRVLGLWLIGCSIAVAALCALGRSSAQGGAVHVLGGVGPGWAPLLGAIGLSLLCAVSVEGGGRLLRAAGQFTLVVSKLVCRAADHRPPAGAVITLTRAPLLAGWSDRGPPRGAPATV